MWDAELTSRVRERKLNEILTFAAMIKIDPSKKDDYVDIVDSLSLDIDACDALIETGGQVDIELEPMLQPEYRSRLGQSETQDEDVFNSYKSAPVEDDDIEEYVRSLIAHAVETITEGSASNREAVDSLKEELAACRARIDALSSELEYSKSAIATAEQERDESRSLAEEAESRAASIASQLSDARARIGELESSLPTEAELEAARFLKEELAACRSRMASLEAELDEAVAESKRLATERDDAVSASAELRSRLDSVTEELESARSRMIEMEAAGDGPEPIDSPDMEPEVFVQADSDVTDDAPVYNPADEPEDSVKMPSEEDPVHCTEPEAADQATPSSSEVPVVLDEEQVSTIVAVREMKTGKIDEFITKALSGKYNETACDDIVTFLKVDVSICDALLSMDRSTEDGILSGMKEVLRIVEESPEPAHQSMYVASLTPEEAAIELGYNRVIEHVQTVMLERYAEKL